MEYVGNEKSRGGFEKFWRIPETLDSNVHELSSVYAQQRPEKTPHVICGPLGGSVQSGSKDYPAQLSFHQKGHKIWQTFS